MIIKIDLENLGERREVVLAYAAGVVMIGERRNSGVSKKVLGEMVPDPWVERDVIFLKRHELEEFVAALAAVLQVMPKEES